MSKENSSRTVESPAGMENRCGGRSERLRSAPNRGTTPMAFESESRAASSNLCVDSLFPLKRAVRVGITGHRQLPPGSEEEIRAKVRSVLQSIADSLTVPDLPAASSSLFGRDLSLACVSSLAEGADQIAAEEALSLGYELHAPLPFPRGEYALDFGNRPESRARYEALLDRASAVFELDGGRKDSGTAYETAGRLMLQHSDVLLAVWDRKSPEGTGGTGQIVCEALSAGIPVVVLPPSDPSGTHLRSGPDGGLGYEGDLAELPHRVREVLFSVERRPGGDAPGERAPGHPSAYQRDYCGELPLNGRWSHRLGIGRLWSGVWDGMLRTFREWSWEEPAEVELDRGEERSSIDNVAELRSYFGAHYARASGFAVYYAGLYRSSFTINYLLSGLAVTLVLLANTFHPLETQFIGLELLCIASILAVREIGRRRRWREKAIDYRILAELFRQMRYLAPLAVVTPRTRPPAHARKHGDLTDTWMNRHFRSVLRQARMPSVKLLPAYRKACGRMLIEEWLKPQAEYHRITSATHERAREFFEAGAGFLFGLTAAACVLHLAAHPLAGNGHAVLPSLVLPLLTLLAASLPAWGAGFHGIASQSEFHRLTERSESMRSSIEQIAGGSLGAATVERVPSYEELSRMAREAAVEMLSEVIDWRVFYRVHDIPTA